MWRWCCVSNANTIWRLYLSCARPFGLVSLFVNDAMIFNSFATMLTLLSLIKKLDHIVHVFYCVCVILVHKIRYFVNVMPNFICCCCCSSSLAPFPFPSHLFPFLIRLAYFSLQQEVIIPSSHCEP